MSLQLEKLLNYRSCVFRAFYVLLDFRFMIRRMMLPYEFHSLILIYAIQSSWIFW